jgi:nucleoside-diphosphate-sugar epimerase
MRVLVTGASGFIGKHVAVRLQSMGHEVVGVCRAPSPDLLIDWRVADLLAPGAAAALMDEVRPDALLHLAWCTEHGKFWRDPVNLTWVARSCDLIEAATRVGVRRIVIAGTCFEYAFLDGDCDERTTPVENHFLYDTAKDACRRVTEAWCQEKGVSFGWARLFHFYGAGEHPARLVGSIARSLARGEAARCSSGQVLRDYMHVADAGAAVAALVASEATGIVNIASGEPVRIADIARALGEGAGRGDLVHLGALPDRPDDPPRITASVDRLRQEVGFSPRFDLRTGLADVYDWWRAQT